MAYDAGDIADWMLATAKEYGEFLTTMKLQRLVYIAHGWHLAARGEPLVHENIQARRWGPVVPSLYEKFEMNGSQAILDIPSKPNIDSETEGLLKIVWEVYGAIPAVELLAILRLPDSPWRNHFRGHDKSVIPNNEIMDHYIQLVGQQMQIAEPPEKSQAAVHA